MHITRSWKLDAAFSLGRLHWNIFIFLSILLSFPYLYYFFIFIFIFIILLPIPCTVAAVYFDSWCIQAHEELPVMYTLTIPDLINCLREQVQNGYESSRKESRKDNSMYYDLYIYIYSDVHVIPTNHLESSIVGLYSLDLNWNIYKRDSGWRRDWAFEFSLEISSKQCINHYLIPRFSIVLFHFFHLKILMYNNLI